MIDSKPNLAARNYLCHSVPVASKSKKTAIFERLFDKRWNDERSALSESVVNLEEVADEIVNFNADKTGRQRLSQKNPANFYKDFTRKVKSANRNWPATIRTKRFTAVGLTGESRCFKFIPLPADREEPFVDVFPALAEDAGIYRISSASLPLAARQLSRGDEPALIQTLVRLRVIETHMALFSPMRNRIVQVDHLQNSVKLRDSEIDALFLAVLKNDDGQTQNVLITCEAKQKGEDLMLEQISRQPLATFESTSGYDMVIAIGARSYAPSKIQIVEFQPVYRATFHENDPLQVAGSNTYTLEPAVDGIGGTPPPPDDPEE
jgi:hypothetical protein